MSDIDKDKLEKIDLLGMVKIFDLQEDFSQGVKDMVAENVKIKSELETYKKIAEKLADKILEMDVDGEVLDFFCKYIPMEKCDEFSDGYCDKCIIDWAKSEVLKNDK